MTSYFSKQPSRRWAHLAVALALSMALICLANAEQQADMLVVGGDWDAEAGQGSRALLWDQPKKDEVPEVEVIEPRPVYAEANKLRGPDTPKFGYSTAPSPATYENKIRVRSEKPSVQVYQRERDWVNARGATDVKTWEGAKYEYKAHSGKGSEMKFSSGKRAFEVNRGSRVEVNFPETSVAVSGGQPLAVDQTVEVFGAGANQTVGFASGAGPNYANQWQVNVGPTNTVGAGRRRLLNRVLLWDQPKKDEVPEVEVIEPRPVYAEANKLRGPDTPKFGYSTAPSPATYENKIRVRSEKPSVQVYQRERDWVNARGATDVKTWEGAKYEYKAHSGKGSEMKFSSGKRAFEVNRGSRVEVNFPETSVAVSGGQPLAVDQSVEVFGAGANQTVGFASGAGPNYANQWQVNVGPTNTVGAGRRRLLNRALLWDQPKKDEVPEVEVIEPRPVYAEANKLRGPDTPKFGYSTAPSPATYENKIRVRSEKPSVQVYQRERDWVNARGATDVKTWEGAKYEYKAHSGKGSEMKFSSGKRAFEVNRGSRVEVNFPETSVAVSGGQPLAVDQTVEVFGAGANQTVGFASGAGPNYANQWQVNVGPTNTVGAGRRRQ